MKSTAVGVPLPSNLSSKACFLRRSVKRFLVKLQRLKPFIAITTPSSNSGTKAVPLRNRNFIVNGHKICPKCKTNKPVSDFNSRDTGKVSSWCKTCLRAYHQGEGKEKARLRSRRYSLKTLYGMSEADWDKLFALQDKSCGICKEAKPRGGRWRVDHDHKTGSVRGILCVPCNTLLGCANDSEDALKSAAWYLERRKIAY